MRCVHYCLNLVLNEKEIDDTWRNEELNLGCFLWKRPKSVNQLKYKPSDRN